MRNVSNKDSRDDGQPTLCWPLSAAPAYPVSAVPFVLAPKELIYTWLEYGTIVSSTENVSLSTWSVLGGNGGRLTRAEPLDSAAVSSIEAHEFVQVPGFSDLDSNTNSGDERRPLPGGL